MARLGVEHSSLQGLTRLACENNRHGNITMTLSLKHFLGDGVCSSILFCPRFQQLTTSVSFPVHEDFEQILDSKIETVKNNKQGQTDQDITEEIRISTALIGNNQWVYLLCYLLIQNISQFLIGINNSSEPASGDQLWMMSADIRSVDVNCSDIDRKRDIFVFGRAEALKQWQILHIIRGRNSPTAAQKHNKRSNIRRNR